MKHPVLFWILEFGFLSALVAQTLPGVWESHGPDTHVETRAFFVDPDQDILYVATTERGVFISETGGSSWDQLPATLDTAVIYRFIKVDPTLFAAGNGNLYLSTDGFSWTIANPPSSQTSAFQHTNLCENFIFEFKHVMYSGNLWGSGLYRCTDGGQNWESVNTTLDEFSITTFLQVGDSLFAATLENGVYVTSDANTWIHIGTGIENKSIEHILHIGNSILAGGQDGLHVRNDGEDWSPAVAPLDTSGITLLYQNAGVIYAGSTTGLYFSTDSAASWTVALAGEEIHCVFVTDSRIYAGTATGLYYSTLPGTDWSAVFLSPDPGSIIDLAGNAATTFALSNQSIHKSLHGETNWFPVMDIPVTAQLHGMILHESYILSYGSQVFRSIDKGLSWKTAYPPVDWRSASILKILEMENGFLAAAGGIFQSGDGIVWTHLPSQIDNETLTTFFAIGDMLLAGTSTSGIFYSSDAGSNWIQSAAPMDDKYIHFINPLDNRVFAGTQAGLFVSDNGGSNWQSAAPELNTIAVTSFCANNDTLLAGTQGQGIYISTDNGNSWNQSVSPMSDTSIDKLYAHNGFIVAGLKVKPIHISHDNGLTWSSADSIFGAQQLIDCSNVDTILFISLWNENSGQSSIHRSIDNGLIWTDLNKNLQRDVSLISPLYLPSQKYLYTCGAGVAFQTLDLEPPEAIKLAPVDTSKFITALDIQLYVEANYADSMILSEDSTFFNTSWQEYQTFADFTLSPTQGEKKIFARFKDFSGNFSHTISTRVELDNLAPIFFNLFIETPTVADLCSLKHSDLTFHRAFEDLSNPSVGQDWYIAPQCKDNPYWRTQVFMIFWPGGTSHTSGIKVKSYSPRCTEFGWPWWENDMYRCAIPGSALNNKGLDVNFFATDTAGNSSTFINQKYSYEPITYFSLPVKLGGPDIGESGVIPGGIDAQAFQIVSTPFSLPENFLAYHLGNFGDHGSGGDWMFWAYDGQWINGNDIKINDGCGYFILTRNSIPLKPILPSSESVITTTRTTAGVWGEIPGWQLRANDWTLIGNPYRTRIELDQLKLKNRDIRLDQASTAFSIYGYSRTGWITDDIALEPWSGLAVFLADSADVIVFADPEDPYTRPVYKSNSPVAKQLKILTEGDWLVQIAAESAGAADNSNFFGVRSDAQAGHDIYDWYEPPRVPGGLAVSFPHPEWNIATTYASDIRALADDGYTWPLQITAEGGTAVTLNFDQLREFPKDLQMWLIDETTSLARDLLKQPQIQVRVPEGTNIKNYQILVGTDSYIANNTAGLNTVPSDFALYQNYPNPFNPVTVIRYALPVEGRVTLQIYDVLGQEVLTVFNNTHYDVGYYEYLVDMTIFSSGVYFYELKVDGETQFVDVKKMILLR